jgi:hypothetical protein
MNFFSEKKNVKDNAYLQIAWKVYIMCVCVYITKESKISIYRNAATINTRIKKRLLRRNTVLLYDIPKLW